MRAARSLVDPAVPITVGPVFLGPKPDSQDPRLSTPFAAAWTLGSLAQLAAAAASAVTRRMMRAALGQFGASKTPQQRATSEQRPKSSGQIGEGAD